MTYVKIEMSELKKDVNTIISEYDKINEKYHKAMKKSIRTVMGREGLKSKIFRKVLGDRAEFIATQFEVLDSGDLVTDMKFKTGDDELTVILYVNDFILKAVEDLRKSILTMGLYHNFKKKGFDADSMRKSKFLKNLGRTGKNYAKKSKYVIGDLDGRGNKS